MKQCTHRGSEHDHHPIHTSHFYRLYLPYGDIAGGGGCEQVPVSADPTAQERVDWTLETDADLDGHVFSEVTQLNAGAVGDGTYLLAGAEGKYTTSTDGGHSWAALQTINGAGSVFLWGVAKDGPKEVAVGSAGALVVRNLDGGVPIECGSSENPKRYPGTGGAAQVSSLSQWHMPCGAATALGSTGMRDAATFGRGNFIAVGNDGKVAVSSNGVQGWTLLDDGDVCDPDNNAHDYRAVARVGSANVLVGTNGRVVLVQPAGIGPISAHTCTDISGSFTSTLGSEELFDVVADDFELQGAGSLVAGPDYQLNMAFLVVGDDGVAARATVTVPASTPLVSEPVGAPATIGGPIWDDTKLLGVWSDDRTRVVVGEGGLVFTQPKEEAFEDPTLWTSETPDGSVHFAAVTGDAVDYLLVGYETVGGSTVGSVYTGQQDVLSCPPVVAPVAKAYNPPPDFIPPDTDTDPDTDVELADLDAGCLDVDTDGLDTEDIVFGPLHPLGPRELIELPPDTDTNDSDTDGPWVPFKVLSLATDAEATISPLFGALMYRLNFVDWRDPGDPQHHHVDFLSLGNTPYGGLSARKEPATRPLRPNPSGSNFVIDGGPYFGSPAYWRPSHGSFVDLFTGWGVNPGVHAFAWSSAGPSWQGSVDGADTCEANLSAWPSSEGPDDTDDTDDDPFEVDLFRDSILSFTRFRSDAGHDFTDDPESFRPGYEPRFQSMKHYVGSPCGNSICGPDPEDPNPGDTDPAPDPGFCASICCQDDGMGSYDEQDKTAGRPLYAPFAGKLYFAQEGEGNTAGATLQNACGDSTETDDTDIDDLSDWDGQVFLIHHTLNIAIELDHVRGCLVSPDNRGPVSVARGERIATASAWVNWDLAVWVNDEADRWRLVSYFDLLPEPLYDLYERDLGFAPRTQRSRNNPVIPMDERDRCPLEPDYDTDHNGTVDSAADEIGVPLVCSAVDCAQDTADTANIVARSLPRRTKLIPTAWRPYRYDGPQFCVSP